MRRAPAYGRVAAVVLGLALASLPVRAAWREPYPASPPGDVVDTLHGVAVPDPWRWLEDGRSPEVQNWTDAQNAVTRRALEGVQGRDQIRAELQRLYRIPTLSAPRMARTRLFWQKREEGQDQPVVWVKDGASTLGPHIAIDPNRLSYDRTSSLDWMFPSPDGKLLAYGTSEGGTEHSTLHVFNVVTGFDGWDTIPNTQHCTVAWDPDGSGFLYSRYAAPGEVPEGREVLHQEIYHHRVMEEWQSDRIAYHGENAPLQELREVTSSVDRKWTFLRTSVDWIRNDLYIRHAGTDETWRPVALGQDGQVSAEVVGTRLLLLTNAGAPRFHVIETDVNTPVFGGREIIPQQRGVIRGMSFVGDRLVLRVEEDAQVRLRVYNNDGAFQHEVPLPAPGNVAEVAGDPDETDFYFTYTSYVYPPTVYHCNVVTNELQPLERFITGFDPLLYSVRPLTARSLDGTRVPMHLVGRANYVETGRRPTLLTGYGGFGVSELPAWNPMYQVWMDHGGVVGYTVLRGGGEFGKRWHEDGRLEKKQKVFDDFESCAEYLFTHALTDSAHLACIGGSNGGLLVGAALTQHPHTWKAAVCRVPLLDMLRYQNFLIGRYWVPEYGSSEDRDAFRWLYAYSPYHHVKPGTAYPATLLTASEGDSRVDPLHARKMAAALQAASSVDAPILLRVEGRAGHGQGKPVSKRIDEAVDILSFLVGPGGLGLELN